MYKRRKQNTKIKKFTSKMQASLLLVFCVVIILFLVLIGRLFYLDKKYGDRYSKTVLSQQTNNYSIIPYKRGDIVDRNGTVLAKSVKVYNLIIDAVVMQEEKSGKQPYIEPTIAALQEAFGIDPQEVYKILEEKPTSRYIVFKKGLSYEEVQVFDELESNSKYIQGIWFEHDYVRTYPNNSMASQVLGFTFSGNVGNSGIEGYYNEYLNGVNGSQYAYYNSDDSVDRVVKAAENGNTIVSTLDANIQQIVENHINRLNEEIGSKNTAVIVANPNNGEILAMASSGGYDLNNPTDLSAYYTDAEVEAMGEEEKLEALNQMWRNFCISDTFEPGSTIKPLTVAMALDEGLVDDTYHFICDGFKQFGSRKIKCAKRNGHGDITLEEVLAFSCNDAIMDLAEKIGRSTFATYQMNFNLGRKTGIDLPGETAGLVYSEEGLNEQELATSAFGQSMSLSMVQVLAAYSSVINGGYYYTPHVVKQITTESGSVVKNVNENYVKQVISEETSELIRNYMKQTVERGTAQKAQIAGYSIGGKTGTAQKLPREDEKYIVSFIGYAPVENPQVVVYVIVDEPQNVEKQSDSGIACNFAKEIMEEIFPFLNVFPTEEVEDDTNKEETTNGEDANKEDSNNEESTSGEAGTQEGAEVSPSPTPSTNDSVYNPEDDDNEIFEDEGPAAPTEEQSSDTPIN